MNISKLFYTCLLPLRKPLLLFALLFSFDGAYAQYSDTSIVEEKTVVDESDNQDDETEKTEYFKNVAEYDSLLVLTRSVPDSILNLFQQDKSYWYSRQETRKGDRTQQTRRTIRDGKQTDRPVQEQQQFSENSLSGQTWFRSLMWIIIIGGFAGALAWYLANNNVSLFRKKEKKLVNEEEGVIPENIFAINYQQEIDRAAAQGNYRLAIRLMYLRVLRNLAEKNVIQYKQDKTNFDYLMQLQSTSYYRDFFRITRHYEYSWYGEFNVSPDAYSIVRHEFDQFEKTTA